MNRAERRRAEKAQAKVATYNFTKEQLEQRDLKLQYELAKSYDKQVQEIKGIMLETAIDCIESALCVVLSDRYSFGKKRLQDVINKLEYHIDCITSEHVTLQDLKAEKERLLSENKNIGAVLKNRK